MTLQDNGDLTIEHRSGDRIETDQITVVGSEGANFEVDWGASGNPGDEWTASESITLGDGTRDPVPGETIRIIWESSMTSDSTVVLKYEHQP